MSKHILCTLVSASSLINGIAFADHPQGKISEAPVDDDTADYFAEIPGYHLVEAAKQTKAEKGAAKTADPVATDPTATTTDETVDLADGKGDSSKGGK